MISFFNFCECFMFGSVWHTIITLISIKDNENIEKYEDVNI